MDLEKIEKIKRIAIRAMFSDDFLMQELVLKGGNALDIVYDMAERSSMDIDFSIEGKFSNLEKIIDKIYRVLNKSYLDAGFKIFDLNFEERPPSISEDMANFWGGYSITFKVHPNPERFTNKDMRRARMDAVSYSKTHEKIFKIEISKYEYCKPKIEKTFENIYIYIYPLEMIVIEKLRALCQNTGEYREIVRSHQPAARAKDFFDIYSIVTNYNIDIYSTDKLGILKAVFNAKRVPIEFLNKLENYKELHKSGFDSLRAIIKPEVKLMEFDHYFDFVLKICQKLSKALRVI